MTTMRVLVTRPKPQGELLCEHLRALGIEPVYLPTIEIAPPTDIELLEQQIAKLNDCNGDCHWLIFISPQAVYRSVELIRKRWPELPAQIKIAAIGAGTAHALEDAGFSSIVYPADDWSSEGLLQLPAFQQIKNQHIALVRGEEGRALLAETLHARGAQVAHWIAYRRCLPMVSQQLVLQKTQHLDLAICTSGEALLNLVTLVGAAGQDVLFQVPMMVVSKRLVELAQTLGFKKIILADNASHDAIINHLKKELGRDVR